ncbi:SAM-dependent methyltransferase [Sphaerisporangium rufum]|uniref:SAM-dependent methyltransferase n=1 Tax=Sphaerisporangium rufum TaxID=1381558 RepID=UPI00195197EC|nr:SAM-dependent methyltransferase [Sphaerisporangium rufum]
MRADSPHGLDVRTPNSARIYDFMLGGKDNFAADREAAAQILRVCPQARDGVRLNREFLVNAVRHLAAEAGVRQFVDIGAGLPTQNNVHEVAHAVDRSARVVYVDNDPIVCVHGRALLADANTVAMVEADLRDPGDLYARIDETGLIDWDRPVAVLMVAMLHFVPDPYDAVARLRELMAPGGHLVISHLTRDEGDGELTDRLRDIYSRSGTPVVPRTIPEIRALFGDFELIEDEQFMPAYLVRRFAALGWGSVGRKP